MLHLSFDEEKRQSISLLFVGVHGLAISSETVVHSTPTDLCLQHLLVTVFAGIIESLVQSSAAKFVTCLFKAVIRLAAKRNDIITLELQHRREDVSMLCLFGFFFFFLLLLLLLLLFVLCLLLARRQEMKSAWWWSQACEWNHLGHSGRRWGWTASSNVDIDRAMYRESVSISQSS